MSRKIVNMVIVLSVALCLPCSILSVFAGGGVVAGAFSEPDEVWIAVDAPQAVSRGEQFPVTVRVTNQANQPQSLDGIDVSLNYLSGIEILEVAPPYISMETNFAFESYYFEQEIPPGKTVEVQFTATGARTGSYTGDIDVCINSPFSCRSETIRTVVR